jgi:hypothetical protein
MMSAGVNWCCEAFKNSYDLAGDRSIAVLVDRCSDGGPEFILQSRAFEKGQEPPDLSTAVPMSLMTESHMQFCPWCGRNLAKWYRKAIDVLIRPGFKIDTGG